MRAIRPSSGAQQSDQIRVTRRRITRQPRGLERPVHRRSRGLQPQGRAIQPFAAIQFPAIGSRRVTLSAHGDVIHDVLPTHHELRIALVNARSLCMQMRNRKTPGQKKVQREHHYARCRGEPPEM